MRVLIVITSLEMGGAERVVLDLADTLVEKGCHVKVVYLRSVKRLEPASNKVDLITFGMTKNPWRFVISLFQLKKVVRLWQPDVIHCHQFHAIILTRLIRCFGSTPNVISSAHNTIDGGRLRSFLYRVTDCFSSVNTNVSKEAVNKFVDEGSFNKEKTIVVHDSIDVDKFVFSLQSRKNLRVNFGIGKDEVVHLAVGRLHEQKDYPNLLHAFSEVKNFYVNSKLLIVGEGPLRDKCEALVERLGLSDKVFFLGLRSDIHILMSICDVFVLSSAWEGFGLVVAEAMACERVVVATDCGGMKEVLGDVGFLVPPRESELLSGAMLSAAQMNHHEKSMLGRRARSRVVQLYSSRALADRWLEIYRSAKKGEKQ